MPSTTPVYKMPYPQAGDQATVPSDIERLALAVEALLVSRAGELRQDNSAQGNVTAAAGAGSTQGAWTDRPSGSDSSWPIEVTIKNPTSAKLLVTLGAYMGVSEDTDCYAEAGFRVYKGAQLLIDVTPARNILWNGTPGVKGTCSRTFMVDVPAPAIVGDVLTVRMFFRNNGTKGTANFSYPSLTVNTRTNAD